MCYGRFKVSLLDKQNPFATLCYLFFVIFITMFTTNPIMLGISFMSGILLFLSLKGIKKTLIRLTYSLIFILVIMIVNPFFSKQGMTDLFYIGNMRVTLESLLNGVAIGVMFSAIFFWFGAINHLLDSDKISYIFSKYTPKIGTILSVSLGLLPKYVSQYKKIDNNLKGLGLYNNVKFYKKIKLKLRVFSTLISWSIENSLTLSDSMSARGYELKGKRVFDKYTFNIGDIVFLIISIIVGICLIVFMGLGMCDYYFYPTFKPIAFDSSFWLYSVTFCFMNLLSVINLWEMLKWQFTVSKI